MLHYALNLPKKLARTLGFPRFLRYEFLKNAKKIPNQQTLDQKLSYEFKLAFFGN